MVLYKIICLSFAFLSITFKSNAQKNEIQSEEVTSKITLATDFTNSTFSNNNPALNSIASYKKLLFTPSIDYWHKSGFGIHLSSTFAGGKNIQAAISPYFDCSFETFDIGVSFTKTFIKDFRNPFINILQLEWNANFDYTKNKVQPGISLSKGNGKYEEIFSYITKKRQVLYNPLRDTLINITFIDTNKNKIYNFNTSIYLKSQFEFENIFKSGDHFTIIPSFMLNAGLQAIKFSSITTIFGPRLKKIKTSTNATSEIEKFSIQSVGLLLNANYEIGKFYINPQLYFDNYVKETTEKRLSLFFTLSTGFIF